MCPSGRALGLALALSVTLLCPHGLMAQTESETPASEADIVKSEMD